MYVPVSNQNTYLFLDLITIIGPLILSFDKKVAFHKYFKPLFISCGITSLVYIIWDIWFTHIGVWKFNQEFVIGVNLTNLPIEEFGFFTVVPYACIFIYTCLKVYFPDFKIPFNITFWGLTIGALTLSVVYINKTYTFMTFGLIFATLLLLFISARTFIQKYWAHLFLAWVIALVPMAYVNGILTSKPVLIYNDSENMAVRIGSIPFEDFFYNFLYMIWSISVFEKLVSLKKQ